MAFFSKKEDLRYIKAFDAAMENVNSLSQQFRKVHFESLRLFKKNFEKEKTVNDLKLERRLFEDHLDLLQKLKFQADLLIDEAFKIVRNETALTEKDRDELKKIFIPPQKTAIQVKNKKIKKKS